MRGIIENTGIKTYVKWEDEKEKLKIGGGSWSINLADCPMTDPLLLHIRYETDKATYRIEKTKALCKGFKRVFKGEEKLVVPFKYWDITLKKQ